MAPPLAQCLWGICEPQTTCGPPHSKLGGQPQAVGALQLPRHSLSSLPITSKKKDVGTAKDSAHVSSRRLRQGGFCVNRSADERDFAPESPVSAAFQKCL